MDLNDRLRFIPRESRIAERNVHRCEREILQQVTTFDFGSWDRRFILDGMRRGYLEIDSLGRFKHSPFFLAD